MVYIIAGPGAGFLVTLAVRGLILEMIRAAGFVRPNYRGEEIPMSAGIVMLPAAFLAVIPGAFLTGISILSAVTFMLGFLTAALLGLLDDVWGSRNTTGLKGHLRSLLKGRLTTGGLKALGGGVLGLILGLVLETTWQGVILAALVIALSMNMINLLDLRPGRAGKGFLVILGVLAFPGWGRPELFFAAVIAGSLLAYLGADLRARAMMGDAGSNSLGLVLGLTAVWSLALPGQLVYLGVLVFFHLLTEKYSLTRIIAGNRVLNYLDLLGRDKR
ncbi:MAG: hypothetical protein AB1815_04695 [Bacillota bacterium]